MGKHAYQESMGSATLLKLYKVEAGGLLSLVLGSVRLFQESDRTGLSVASRMALGQTLP